jgi:hypothetical protein
MRRQHIKRTPAPGSPGHTAQIIQFPQGAGPRQVVGGRVVERCGSSVI